MVFLKYPIIVLDADAVTRFVTLDSVAAIYYPLIVQLDSWTVLVVIEPIGLWKKQPCNYSIACMMSFHALQFNVMTCRSSDVGQVMS